MVIPAELFQVKHAAETRVFLSNFFARVTIITFKKLVFSSIQQEVVLLLCEKEVASDPGIRVVELDNLAALAQLDMEATRQIVVKTLEHSTEKWTKYFLEEEEIQLLRTLKADPRIGTCGDQMEVDVGIVTGRNDFFMLDAPTVAQWKLGRYTQKVVSKSAHFKGIAFSEDDFDANMADEQVGYLFIPPNKDFDDLPKACQAYIRYGEEQDFHTGYKCRIRKRWYITPSLWAPDAFALRQVGEYPRLILNTADASSTDTIHRARFKPGSAAPHMVAVSFINSLSFAFSEILGRSYGGGVLTFEPTEIEEIPLPLLNGQLPRLDPIDSLIRQKRIGEALDRVDKVLLVEQVGFSETQVQLLRGIWKKLSDRRGNRK